MSITTTAEPAEQQHQNVNLFLTLEVAGAMVRKSAVWVERHLTAYRRSGAPAVLAGFTSQDSERAAVKLVERDLQRNGVDLVVAAAGVGLTSAAGGVAQVVTAAVFFAWAGSAADQGSAFHLPDSTMVLVAVVVLLMVAGLLLATRFGKRLWARLRLQLRTLTSELARLARQPSKLLMLFGGSVLGKVCSVLMLSQSLQAFGYDVSFARLGAMYITATTIAAAAPTPGGVGAIEAALAAGLSGLGVASAPAVAVVMLFRVVSYWFPVLPCWLALRHVQRHEIA